MRKSPAPSKKNTRSGHSPQGTLSPQWGDSSCPTPRNTVQRNTIHQVFKRNNRPLSPEEVLKSARKSVPTLGIATVYRTINALIKEGCLIPVHLPGEGTRYEVAGKTHHHHFHCRGCNSVFEIEGCPGNFSKLTPPGFSLEDHQLVLYGVCDTCNHH